MEKEIHRMENEIQLTRKKIDFNQKIKNHPP